MADDQPDDQPPDFERIGAQIGYGMKSAGFGLQQLSGFERVGVNILISFLLAVIKAAEPIIEGVGRLFEPVEQIASTVFSPFLARIVGHVLGADISTEAIHERLNRSGDGAVGKVVAETVFDIFKGPGGELAPGDEAAKRVMGAIGHMTISAWAEPIILEWAAEYLGWDVKIEAVTQLAHELIQNMGINRIAGRAMRPLATVLLSTPLQWSLNKTYRPKMLAAADAIRHWRRGHLDVGERDEVLAREGYGDRAIEALLMDGVKQPAPADLDLLVRTGAWTRDQAIQSLRDGGEDATTAERTLQLEELKLLRTFQIQEAQFAVAAYGDWRIDELTLNDAVDGLQLDDTTRGRLLSTAFHRRQANVKHLSLGEAQQATKAEIWSITDYRAYLEAFGYTPDAALTLELLMQHELNASKLAAGAKAQAAADRAAAAAARRQQLLDIKARIVAEHATFSGTPAEADRLVVRGLMPADEYRQILIDHQIAPADASALATLAQQNHDAYVAAQTKKTQVGALTKTPAVALGTLETAVKLGTLSMPAFEQALAARKYSSENIATIVQLLEHEIADRAAAAQTHAAAAAKLATRHLSLADQDRAVRRGLVTIDQYRAFLVGQKFTSTDVATLVGLIQDQIAADTVAQAKHAAAAAKLAASHLSLAQEDTAVRDGVQTVAQYTAFLAAHGFDAADQATLVALLEEQLADDKATADKQTAAATLLHGKGLSLGETQTAVVAGVVTLDQYRAFLVAGGVSAADADVLVASITPKLIAANQARARQAALELEPGQPGVTLLQFHKAVIAGVSTVAEYDTFLRGRGYSDADRQQLVDVIAGELAQKAAAAATKAAATHKLAAKNISLAQVQQAVKDGLRTLADYAAFLRQQGFSAVDVAVLVDELQHASPAGVTGL